MTHAPPQTADGVGSSEVWLPPGPWPDVLAFLLERFPAIDAAAWRSRSERGLISDGNGQPIDIDSPYAHGRHLYYFRELPQETPIPFEAEVLYRDAQLLVADKPHFLPVVPAGRYLQQTLLVRLRRRLDLPDLVPLHRIDRDTAGLVLFSVDPQSRGAYQQLFAERRVDKRYLALAAPLPDRSLPLTHRSRLVRGEPFFRMQEAEGAVNSETRIEGADDLGDCWRYHLHPVTGRKHQLRVHLAALGIPILNDPLYPVLAQNADAAGDGNVETGGQDDYGRPLQLLAQSIAFTDPLSGATRRFESRRSLSPTPRNP